MKVLITGVNGQLGLALLKCKPNFICNKSFKIIKADRNLLNLSIIDRCKEIVKLYKPDWIINCGAYTNVEKAEIDTELAFNINAEAPKAFAESLKEYGGRLLQISTDYVFSGNQCMPYKTNEKRDPLNIYGKSKLQGEKAVEDLLGKEMLCHIVRTSWLISPFGKNFALKILDLHSKHEKIRIISDQIGSPTSSYSLACACWRLIEKKSANNKELEIPTKLHWTDSGVASWYDLAFEIGEISSEIGLIKRKANIIPIKSNEFKTMATRPYYSVLDCDQTIKALDMEPRHWKVRLREILSELVTLREI